MTTAEAIQDTLQSDLDKGKLTNVVDVIDSLARATTRVANAILPAGVAPGHDASGGTIDSLTEAVMGVTAGLHAIAGAISELAEAVANRPD